MELIEEFLLDGGIHQVKLSTDVSFDDLEELCSLEYFDNNLVLDFIIEDDKLEIEKDSKYIWKVLGIVEVEGLNHVLVAAGKDLYTFNLFRFTAEGVIFRCQNANYIANEVIAESFYLPNSDYRFHDLATCFISHYKEMRFDDFLKLGDLDERINLSKLDRY